MVHARCQIALMSEEYCLQTTIFSSPWLKPGDSKNGGIVDGEKARNLRAHPSPWHGPLGSNPMDAARNYSEGGSKSREKRMTRKCLFKRPEQVPTLFTQGREVTADATEDGNPLVGAKAARDFLLHG